MDNKENIPIEEKFKVNFVGLIEKIYRICFHLNNLNKTEINPTVIKLFIPILENYDPKKMIKKYIENVYPYWENMRNKEQDYFKTNAQAIFGSLPFDNVSEHIEKYTELFEQKDDNDNYIITEQDKNMIWRYQGTFVKFSIKYLHEMREPKIVLKNGKNVPCYTKKFIDKISNEELIKHAEKWNINLVFKE